MIREQIACFSYHHSSSLSRFTEDFEILDGDTHGLPDTLTFLKSLAELDVDYESGKIPEKRQLRERKAAAGLFNWEVRQL